MPSLSDHQSGEFVKVLYCGSSGTGKTGSLVSLMPDYDLRILDMDNGLDALVNFAKEQCPTRLSSVEFETIRDKYVSGALGPMVQGTPKAFVRATKLLDKWTDETKPEEWGPKKILVVDSLTQLSKAAFEWARAQNPSSKDPRQWFKGAQDVIDNVIAVLTSETFRTNVIVLTHIDLDVDKDGTPQKAYASSIGKALGPKIPRYFNTMILAESQVMGSTVKRKIRTAPTALMDLKNPAPMRIGKEFDLETGMLQLFNQLKGTK